MLHEIEDLLRSDEERLETADADSMLVAARHDFPLTKTTMSDPIQHLELPAPIASGLTKLRDDLQKAAGANLQGLILYGGLARKRYHPGRSDANIVVLLRDVSPAALLSIAPALRTAARAVAADPLILAPAEVERTAAAFPTKFIDIKSHHVVLCGEDPFVSLEVPREHIRLRIEQELRNLGLRLRRRFVAISNSPPELAAALATVARPLALELSALLQFAGKVVPDQDRTAAILALAAETFQLDREALAQLAALREQPRPAGDMVDLFGRVLQTVARAADVAGQMKEAAG